MTVVEIAKLENFVFKAKFLVQFLSFEYEGKYYIEDDFWEMTAENQEYKKECDSIINDIKTQLGEGRLIRRIEGEDAKTITLEELLNPR